MRHLPNISRHPVSGVWTHRYYVPPRLQAVIGQREIWKSLRTKIVSEANRRAIIYQDGELANRIAAAELKLARTVDAAGAALSPAERPTREKLTRALAAIQTWAYAEKGRMEERCLLGIGMDDFTLFGADRTARVNRIDELTKSIKSDEPDEGLDEELVGVLGRFGVTGFAPNDWCFFDLRREFRKATLDVACYSDEQIARALMRRGAGGSPFAATYLQVESPKPPFSDIAPPPATIQGQAAALGQAKTSISIDDLLAKFLADKTKKRPKKDVDEITSCFRRLKEFTGGNIGARHVMPEHIVAIKEALWLIPARLTQAQERMTFKEIIAQSGTGQKLRTPRSVKKWMDWYSLVFSWGVDHAYVDTNPVKAGMKPKIDKHGPPAKIRYGDDDLAAIFATPMFQGFSDKSPNSGYRKQSGTRILKDAKYWLPILAVWSGLRLEEAGAATVAHLKCVDGIDHFDFSERVLKNPGSSRWVPIHPKLIELGFLDYVADLRLAGKAYLFPNLPHHSELAATRQFTKWWGNWSAANAKTKGEGFDDPKKSFHSFRHGFKRVCREAGIPDAIHDLLTGHRSGSVSDSYGRDEDGSSVSLKTLADNLAKVIYPTFPALP
jgi:integrase